jgi:hypothetical protein
VVVGLLPPTVVVLEPVLVVLVVVAFDVPLTPVDVDVDADVAPPAGVGRHCEYHVFENVQVHPETHVVAPVQFKPPPTRY